MKLDKDKIILKVQRAITLFSDELVMRSRVREIITERLSLKVPAKSDQDLVKDLHCG
jgi:hypothetical protein